MSCNSLIMLPTWTILTTFWLSVLQQILRPARWSSKESRANFMATNSLQVEDFRESSVDQFLWQIKMEPLMKASQPVEEVSEKDSSDGTKGFCQKGIPFKDLRLPRQNLSSSFAGSARSTIEFQEWRALITRCKYLVMIWVTFPQLAA